MKNAHKNIFQILLAFVLVAALFSCGKNAETAGKANEKEPTEEAEEAEEKEPAGFITLTQAQLDAVGITIGTIEQKNLADVVKANGQLEVPPQNRADVNVLMPGIIQKINVLEGQQVSKGQVVALLENPDLVKLQQDYLTSKRGFSYVQSEYERQQELKKADAGTGKVYQQAEANYQAERARLIGMEKQLQQLGINPATVARGQLTRLVPVKAPIGGTVGLISISTGGYADAGNRLMEIIDNRYIHCDLIVFEKDLFRVKKGQQVEFVLTNQNNASFTGEIYGINKSFENDSKGIAVHSVIKNANKFNLVPGMYVSALIKVGEQVTSAVPVEAVVRSAGKNYIYVQTESTPESQQPEPEKEEGEAGEGEEKEEVSSGITFRQVEVVTGISELGYIQITPMEKLPKDVKVITKGAFYVLSKTTGGEEEEE